MSAQTPTRPVRGGTGTVLTGVVILVIGVVLLLGTLDVYGGGLWNALARLGRR